MIGVGVVQRGADWSARLHSAGMSARLTWCCRGVALSDSAQHGCSRPAALLRQRWGLPLPPHRRALRPPPMGRRTLPLPRPHQRRHHRAAAGGRPPPRLPGFVFSNARPGTRSMRPPPCPCRGPSRPGATSPSPWTLELLRMSTLGGGAPAAAAVRRSCSGRRSLHQLTGNDGIILGFSDSL